MRQFRSTKCSRRSRKHNLAFERLENRCMLAGNITAAIDANRNLVIAGDNLINEVTISEIPSAGSGVFVLTPNSDTSINGGAPAAPDQFSKGDVAQIRIQMLDGNDRVFINGINSTLPNFGGQIEVIGGQGNDVISVGNATANVIVGNLTISGGAGEDTITVNNTNIGGSVQLVGEAEKDFVRIGDNPGANIVGGDVLIGDLTGDGNDEIDVDRLWCAGNIDIVSGEGPDDLDIGQLAVPPAEQIRTVSAAGYLTIVTGAHGDTLDISQTHIVGNIRIDMGTGNEGNDTLRVNFNFVGPTGVTTAGGFSVWTGEGADLINIQQTYVGLGTLSIDSGAGAEGTLTVNLCTARSLQISTGAGTDLPVVTGNIIDDFYADCGQGNDTITIIGSPIRRRGFVTATTPGVRGQGSLFAPGTSLRWDNTMVFAELGNASQAP